MRSENVAPLTSDNATDLANLFNCVRDGTDIFNMPACLSYSLMASAVMYCPVKRSSSKANATVSKLIRACSSSSLFVLSVTLYARSCLLASGVKFFSSTYRLAVDWNASTSVLLIIFFASAMLTFSLSANRIMSASIWRCISSDEFRYTFPIACFILRSSFNDCSMCLSSCLRISAYDGITHHRHLLLTQNHMTATHVQHPCVLFQSAHHRQYSM